MGENSIYERKVKSKLERLVSHNSGIDNDLLAELYEQFEEFETKLADPVYMKELGERHRFGAGFKIEGSYVSDCKPSEPDDVINIDAYQDNYIKFEWYLIAAKSNISVVKLFSVKKKNIRDSFAIKRLFDEIFPEMINSIETVDQLGVMWKELLDTLYGMVDNWIYYDSWSYETNKYKDLVNSILMFVNQFYDELHTILSNELKEAPSIYSNPEHEAYFFNRYKPDNIITEADIWFKMSSYLSEERKLDRLEILKKAITARDGLGKKDKQEMLKFIDKSIIDIKQGKINELDKIINSKQETINSLENERKHKAKVAVIVIVFSVVGLIVWWLYLREFFAGADLYTKIGVFMVLSGGPLIVGIVELRSSILAKNNKDISELKYDLNKLRDERYKIESSK